MRTVGYSDSTLANIEDLLSQLERVILLVDADENAASILLNCYEMRHANRSLLPTYLIAFEDLFLGAFAIKDSI